MFTHLLSNLPPGVTDQDIEDAQAEPLPEPPDGPDVPEGAEADTEYDALAESADFDRVHPEDGCPKCHETRVDWLANDGDGNVTCQTCGHEYTTERPVF